MGVPSDNLKPNYKQMKILKNVNLLLKFIIISIILIIPFKSAFSQSLATNYFVDAQKGNDANNGLSVEKPFKTISKAKDAVRFLDKSGSSNITVNLRGGTYFQDQTLEFTEKDGGTENCKIIYRNYKDEVPVISGGKKITGWKLFDNARNISVSSTWAESSVMMTSVEIPGIYIQTDKKVLFTFDNIDSKIVSSDLKGLVIQLINPTVFTANVRIFDENTSQTMIPLGYHSFLKWPEISLNPGETKKCSVSRDGKITQSRN